MSTNRRSITISSEQGRSEVVYGELPVLEIESRIAAYQHTYGSPLESYASRVCCDTAGVYELSDLMDWENLVQELRTRRPERVRVL